MEPLLAALGRSFLHCGILLVPGHKELKLKLHGLFLGTLVMPSGTNIPPGNLQLPRAELCMGSETSLMGQWEYP